MRLAALAISLSVMIPAMAFAHDAVAKCKVMANSTPPLSIIRDNMIEGFSIDLLAAMYTRTGRDLYKCDIRPVPWPRGLHELEHYPERIMFSVAKTPERSPKFKWVGPLYKVNMALIGKKDRQFDIKDMEDLKNYRVTTLRASVPERILMANGFETVDLERSSKPLNSIKMLDQDRVDLMAHVFAPFAYDVRKLGLNPSDYEEAFILHQIELFYAFSADTPDSLINELQQALDDLKYDGDAETPSSYQALLSNYYLRNTLFPQEDNPRH